MCRGLLHLRARHTTSPVRYTASMKFLRFTRFLFSSLCIHLVAANVAVEFNISMHKYTRCDATRQLEKALTECVWLFAHNQNNTTQRTNEMGSASTRAYGESNGTRVSIPLNRHTSDDQFLSNLFFDMLYIFVLACAFQYSRMWYLFHHILIVFGGYIGGDDVKCQWVEFFQICWDLALKCIQLEN